MLGIEKNRLIGCTVAERGLLGRRRAVQQADKAGIEKVRL
jgi:hypothetical protein